MGAGMSNFAAQVDAWVKKTKARQTAVYRRSVELIGEEMARTKPQGGNVPFLTGNLARSLLASTAGMPKIADGPYSGSNVGQVAATLNIGQSVWLGYQAIYARRRNYGYAGNEQGDYFVEGAIAQWQQIVRKAAAEIKAKT